MCGELRIQDARTSTCPAPSDGRADLFSSCVRSERNRGLTRLLNQLPLDVSVYQPEDREAFEAMG